MNEANVCAILRLVGVLAIVYGGYELTIHLIACVTLPKEFESTLLYAILVSVATVGWGGLLWLKAGWLTDRIVPGSPPARGR